MFSYVVRRHSMVWLWIFRNRTRNGTHFTPSRTEHINWVVKNVHWVASVFSSCCSLTHTAMMWAVRVRTHISRVCSDYLVMVSTHSAWRLGRGSNNLTVKSTWWISVIVSVAILNSMLVPAVLIPSHIWPLISWTSFIYIQRLLHALVGLVMRIEDVLQFFLFQMMGSCCSMMACRGVRPLDRLQHTNSLILRGSQAFKRP
jgi:hypothetical protein